MWNEDFKAGYIFTNEAGNRMVIAEKRGAGLGSMMAAASNPLGGGEESGPAKKFGKKVHLIDTETGQSIWKKEKKMDGNVLYITPYDNGFMVVHDEGLNIYDYNAPKATGAGRRTTGEKGVKRVEFEDEGIMVYFKNKRMLLDPVTGDEKWKKAEKLEKEPGGFLWRLAQQGKVEPIKIGQHEVKIYANRVTD